MIQEITPLTIVLILSFIAEMIIGFVAYKKSDFIKIAIHYFVCGFAFCCILVTLFPDLTKSQSSEQKVSYTISPKEDYIEFDAMQNLSDSSAMIIQEIRCGI